jgi:four helix bundle protein
MGAKEFTDLIVWRKADLVAAGVYDLTARFPLHQQYSLTSQMQRAALSVPSNIAEGFHRRTVRDKARFYNIAEGSAAELKYYLMFSRRLGYWQEPSLLPEVLEEVRRMLRALVKLTLAGGFPPS